MKEKAKKAVMKKRKRVIRLKPTFWFFLCLFFLSLVLVVLLLTHPVFIIQYVRVEGNETIHSRDLVEKAGKFDENIFLFSKKEMEEAISKVEGIKTVKVKKEFPNRLLVVVDEEYVLATIDYEDKKYFINDDGIIKDKAVQQTVPLYRPIPISGIKELKLGQQIFHDDRLLPFLKLLMKSTINDHIEKVGFENLDNIDIICKGVDIRFGPPNDLHEKMTILMAVMDDIQQRDIDAVEIILNQGDHPIVVTRKEN